MATRSSAEATAAGAPASASPEQVPADHDTRAKAPSGHAVQEVQTIQGFIERIEPQRVSGWAWDKLEPEIFLEIEIVLDGKILATTRADRFREDLRSATGDGRHAFQAFLDDPLSEQMKGAITAVARSRHDGPATRLVNLVCDRVGPSLSESAAPALATPADAARRESGQAAAGQWLVHLAAADRKLQATCSAALEEIQEALSAVAATAAEVADSVKNLRATQEQLAQQSAALEVFQVRFDATLKGMEEKAAGARRGGRPDRGLRAVVGALAALSAASLALGLWSLFGG